MKRSLGLFVLVSAFLLLLGSAVYAATTSLTLSDVTNQDMIIKGSVQKPNISIVIFDVKTNKLVGEGTTQADSQGFFWTQIVFYNPLQGYNDLVIRITDIDDYNNGAMTDISVILNCWTEQASQRMPCDWKIRGPMLGGDTMIPGH